MAHFHNAAAGIDHLERLSRNTSPLHRLHTAAKLAGTAVFLVTVISFPSQNLSGIIPFFLYPAILMSVSGTPYKPLLSRLVIAIPFALAGGISNLIIMREPAFVLLHITWTTGMVSFVSIMLKMLLSVFAVLILIAATPFANLAAVLTRSQFLRPIGLQVVLTFRYISTLLDEVQDMHTAYILRAPNEKTIRMKDMGSFMGQLLLRSIDRAERVYYAMKCRGFTGAYHSGTRQIKFGDILYMVIITALCLLCRFFNLSMMLGYFFTP
ncbi:cobalt ECF transporter T component CbiQ [Spirochaetia bacterium]|nr:cobalt ECF transporter T component CbiQ [Spirochaetia bacterium]